MNIPDKVVSDDYFATEWTQFKNEIENSIESSGQTLAVNSVQLKQAMARYAGNADAYVDSGIADAYVLDPIANAVSKTNDAPSAYINLQKCKFVAGNTNTGASTVNIAGVGVVSIKTDSWTNALAAGDIEAGKVYELIYSLGDNSFELIKINDAGLASTARPQDTERGMILSNGTDADRDIDVSAGYRADSIYSVFINQPSVVTKQIDATWADGTNTGGRAAGVSLSADTWYHVFELGKTTGVANAGFDTSITASNLLADAAVISAGYTKILYRGSVLTDGSSNIIPGSWHELSGGGLKFMWDSPFADFSGISFHLSAALRTVSAPLGIKTQYISSIYMQTGDGGGNHYLLATDPDQTDVAPSTTIFTLQAIDRNAENRGEDGAQPTIFTDISSQIRIRCGATTAPFYSITAFGYIYQT